MHTWSKSPVWKLAIALALGIASAYHLPELALLPLLVLLISLLLLDSNHYQSKLIFISFFLLGYLIQSQTESPSSHHALPATEDFFIVRAVEMPYQKNERTILIVEVIPKFKDDFSGKLQVQGDESWNRVSAGQVLGGFGRVLPFTGPGLPGDFDYSAYMKSKGIVAQWKVTEPPLYIKDDANIKDLILRTRQKLIGRLAMHKESGRLIAALVLGWKAELDKSTKESFRHSGVMHVLAVSGLHVGLVMLLIQFMTRFLRRNMVLSILRYLIILGSIWFYAMLSGGSDSVLRSASMCSFLGLSVILNRKSSGLNLLGIAALVLLCISPGSLFQPGFQLSFTAVAGLILYQPKSVIRKRHYALEYLMNASRTSIVAQLWTSALAIYYFNSLPLYFLIGNLIILPVATLLLYSGIAGLAFHSVPFLSDLLDALTNALANSMLYSAAQISNLPYSEIQLETFPWHWLLIILVTLVFIGDMLKLKSIRPALWISLCILIGSLVDLCAITPQSPGLIFGRISYQELSLVCGNDSINRTFKSSDENSSLLDYSDEDVNLQACTKNNMKIVFVSKWKSASFSQDYPCDILVLAGPYPTKKCMDELNSIFKPKMLVLHQAYSEDKIKDWKEYIPSSVPLHSLRNGWISLKKIQAGNELSLSNEDY